MAVSTIQNPVPARQALNVTYAAGVVEQFSNSYRVGNLVVVNFAVYVTREADSDTWWQLFALPSGLSPDTNIYPLWNRNGMAMQGLVSYGNVLVANPGTAWDDQILRGCVTFAI